MEKNVKTDKKKINYKFNDLLDSEYYDALENEENLNKGIISEEEFKRNEYIRKTRENLAGGDA